MLSHLKIRSTVVDPVRDYGNVIGENNGEEKERTKGKVKEAKTLSDPYQTFFIFPWLICSTQCTVIVSYKFVSKSAFNQCSSATITRAAKKNSAQKSGEKG